METIVLKVFNLSIKLSLSSKSFERSTFFDAHQIGTSHFAFINFGMLDQRFVTFLQQGLLIRLKLDKPPSDFVLQAELH